MQANLMDTLSLPEEVRRGCVFHLHFSLEDTDVFILTWWAVSCLILLTKSTSSPWKSCLRSRQPISAPWEDRAAPCLMKVETTAPLRKFLLWHRTSWVLLYGWTWEHGIQDSILGQGRCAMCRMTCVILWRNGMKPSTVSTAMSSSSTCHCNCSHALCASPFLKGYCSVTLKPNPEMQN